MKKVVLKEVLLLIFFPILFIVIAIPQIDDILKTSKEEEFINTAKLIVLSAENKYLKNNYNGINNVITCEDIIDLGIDYSFCSIYIENDKISVTLNGRNRFENMNVCSKTINNINIDTNCDGICFKTKIYDVYKPYSISNYESCIRYGSKALINKFNNNFENIDAFCKGEKVSEYINKLIENGITEEELVSNNVINGTINNVCIPNEFESSCLSFKIYSEENINYAEVTNYDDSCGPKVLIPSKIMGVSVEGIKDYAFSGKKINEVIFPSTIRYIGTGAFQGHGDGADSSLRGVYLSNTLDLSHLNNLKAIDYFAFADNNINKLKLPDNIEFIGSYAFSGNTIKGILDLSNTKLKRISPYSFSGSKITSLSLPETLESIGYTAFAGNNINGELDLSLNTNLIEIEEDAFADNDIIGVKLPISISNIKSMSFYNNNISGILDLSLNTNLISIGNNSFMNNNIEKVILPINIDKIGDGAFFKNNDSNNNLTTIINSSNKLFDWNIIISENKNEPFDYGSINDVNIIEKP